MRCCRLLGKGTILSVNYQEFEGTILLKWNDVKLRVCYNIPERYARELLYDGENIIVDLWLLYGTIKKLDKNKKDFPKDSLICGGRLIGQVSKILSENELRLDCGWLIDICNEEPLYKIASGDFVETVGTFHVYFPGTEWER